MEGRVKDEQRREIGFTAGENTTIDNQYTPRTEGSRLPLPSVCCEDDVISLISVSSSTMLSVHWSSAERSFGIDGVRIAICTITEGLVIGPCRVVVELLPRIPNMGWKASDVVVVAEEVAVVLMDDGDNAEVFCRGKSLQFSCPGSISSKQA